MNVRLPFHPLDITIYEYYFFTLFNYRGEPFSHGGPCEARRGKGALLLKGAGHSAPDLNG